MANEHKKKLSFSIEKLEEDKKEDIPVQQKIIPKHPFRLLLSGESGSGKTLCLLNLLLRNEFYRGFFRYIILISPNYHNDLQYQVLEKYIIEEEIKAKKNKQYKPVILEHYESFNAGEMDEILNELSEAKEKMGRSMKPVLFLLDDVIDDSKLMNSKFFSMLGTRSRHYNASVIITTQSYMRVKRTTRLNMTHIIVFKPRTKGEEDRIYNEIISGCSKNEFSKLCDFVYSEPFRFLVVNIANPKDKLYMNFEYKIQKKNNTRFEDKN